MSRAVAQGGAVGARAAVQRSPPWAIDSPSSDSSGGGACESPQGVRSVTEETPVSGAVGFPARARKLAPRVRPSRRPSACCGACAGVCWGRGGLRVGAHERGAGYSLNAPGKGPPRKPFRCLSTPPPGRIGGRAAAGGRAAGPGKRNGPAGGAGPSVRPPCSPAGWADFVS